MPQCLYRPAYSLLAKPSLTIGPQPNRHMPALTLHADLEA